MHTIYSRHFPRASVYSWRSPTATSESEWCSARHRLRVHALQAAGAGTPSHATKYLGLDIKGEVYSINPDLFWDGARIPLQDNSVDCAIATEVFEHCQDAEIVMSESLRVLKPGGLLFFTVPFLWPLHDVPHDHYRYTLFSLERHLRNAGFSHICLEALGGWDKSLAQMIGLWVRRRPISSVKRVFLSSLALLIVRWLSRNPEPAEAFGESSMITGMAGTAIKP